MFDYDAERQKVDGLLAKRLFFIVGAMKSGNTWLQLLLDGHPAISCRGEGHFVDYLSQFLQKAVNDYNRNIDAKNKTIFTEIEGYPLLGRDHLGYLIASAIALLMAEQSADNGVEAVGEATPGNVRDMPMLHELFPEARFVHIIRDGRDAAVSAWFHNLRVSPGWAKEKFGSLTNYAPHYAAIWADAVARARAFAAAHPEPYLEVRYEDLHDDPDAAVRRLLRFLDVDASDEAVERCREAGSFKRLAKGRRRGEEHRGSHFRKGIVGDWRNHLDARALESFNERAGSLLSELGYA